MTNILSIHTGHDASITFWKDYKQLFISKEERLNRIKNWGKDFPKLSFELFVNKFDPQTVDVLLLGRNFFKSDYFKENLKVEIKKILKKILFRKEKLISVNMACRRNLTKNEKDFFDFKKIKRELFLRDDVEVIFCDHHLAHALPCLFFNPKWKNALLYTSDGGGDGMHYSFNFFNRNKLHQLYGGNDLLYKKYTPNSLGQMYAIVTEICGFKRNRHEGKITGLAAYGKPLSGNEICSLYSVNKKNGKIISLFDNYDQLKIHLLKIYNKIGRDNFASSAQYALEKLTITSIKILKKKYPFSNIGLAGGVFANVRLNQKISEIDGINDIFIFPPMGDEGLVIGYVLDYLLKKNGIEFFLKQRRELNSVSWGEECKNDTFKIPKGVTIYKNNNIVSETAKLLLKSKVCAIFEGRMEYGPRALGNRSIMINPSNKKINDVVNKRLGRTEFMPFAPYVLSVDAESVFEVNKCNKNALKFMTITTNVKKKWRKKIQATVHVDYTARPQIIKRSENKLYYDILKEFKKLSGIPCLVNTSFNAHEEPIINKISEAFEALKKDRIDFLITSNKIFKKKL